jgi:hypothetical protein
MVASLRMYEDIKHNEINILCSFTNFDAAFHPVTYGAACRVSI